MALKSARARMCVCMCACLCACVSGVLVLAPLGAAARKGDYANIELDGRGGSSVSSLGKNDIPGAVNMPCKRAL